ARFDLLPLLDDTIRRFDARDVAEDVRVATDQLVGDRAQRVCNGEASFVFRDPREEDAFEDEVSNLSAEIVVVAAIDRIEHFVGFLEYELPERLERLLVIPRAPAGPPQARHAVAELLEGMPG